MEKKMFTGRELQKNEFPMDFLYFVFSGIESISPFNSPVHISGDLREEVEFVKEPEGSSSRYASHWVKISFTGTAFQVLCALRRFRFMANPTKKIRFFINLDGQSIIGDSVDHQPLSQFLNERFAPWVKEQEALRVHQQQRKGPRGLLRDGNNRVAQIFKSAKDVVIG